MLRPPSTIRSSGLRPPVHTSEQQKHSIERKLPPPSLLRNQTNEHVIQSRPSIFPRNQAHTPMPSLARRTSIGANHPSNVQKRTHDEKTVNINYSIKQVCDNLGYDYQYLIEEKRRIGYTGAGLIIPEQTEVDKILLTNIDVPFGIWIYKYVRLYPDEPLAKNINERQFVPERIDQNESLHLVRPMIRTQRQTIRILDLFVDKMNENEYQSKSYLPHHQHATHLKSDQQLSIIKRSETQIIKTKLDNKEFNRSKEIHLRELKYSNLQQRLMQQLNYLYAIDDSDMISMKFALYDAVLQRFEKILSMIDI